jgi:hypothetical protein
MGFVNVSVCVLLCLAVCFADQHGTQFDNSAITHLTSRNFDSSVSSGLAFVMVRILLYNISSFMLHGVDIVNI